MGDSGPDPEKGDGRGEEADEGRGGLDRPRTGLRREPSFSRWCGEDGIERPPGFPPESSEAKSGGGGDETDEFELPLLQEGGSGRGGPEADRQAHNGFRQRSMHLNASFALDGDGNGNGKKYAPLDIESGGVMSHSDSRAKLEADGEYGQSTLSAAVVLKTLSYILLWYTFSTSLTLYNKSLLGDRLGKFPAPLLMNTVHFALQAILSNIIVWYQSRRLESKATMAWRDYFLKVVPTALGTALDINLSNASLVFISVTFATMCKSASPIFLLLFAFAFRLETPSIKLLGIIFIISVGVLLTVVKETEFEFWGFIFVMLASVMSGFRWSMTQILLQKEVYGLKNPLTLMGCVTPVMAIATAVLSLILDPWHEFRSNGYFNNSQHIMQSCLLMLVGGALAFSMVLTEYILVSATSAVTVTIAGVVKEAVTIVVAVFYFHDHFTLLKGIGLMTIMIGVGLFNLYKYQRLQKGLTSENEEASSPISNGTAKYVILDDMNFEDDDISSTQ
uniref:Putative sugar phosphate/phosphate translocator At1g06470 n=1 Tax=Anthurium amnicola TaxID=1678845 RepID=A0A1D1ZIQ0_9ARAE